MKLYYSKGACSLVVRIILHELHIAASFEAVNLKTKQTESGDDFLKISAKGVVPTLVLGNGEVLTENAVILQYLADQCKANILLPPIGDFKRYRVLEWLNFVTTELHKGCAPLFNPKVPAEIKEEIFKFNLKNKLNFLESHFIKNQFLQNEQFTLPDAYLFVILRWLPSFSIDITQWPNLARYYANVQKKDSIQLALKEEGLSA